VVTRLDERTVRRWRVGVEHRLIREDRFDSPILHVSAGLNFAADGSIDVMGRQGTPQRHKITGGPFRSFHAFPPGGTGSWVGHDAGIVVDQTGKPSLVTLASREKWGPLYPALQPMTGDLKQPVLDAATLSGKRGPLVAVRCADAAYLWHRQQVH